MNCHYCKKSFISERALLDHKRRSKYCLAIKEIEKLKLERIEKLKIEHDKEIEKLKLEHDKEIEKLKLERDKETEMIERDKYKQEYDRKIEKLKLERDIEKLELERDMYKRERDMYERERDMYKRERDEEHKTIKQLALRPTNTTNTLVFAGPLDLSEKRVRDCVDSNLSLNHICNGQKGVAKFAIEHLLRSEDGKKLYICTDTSRNSYTYKGTNGEIIKDKEAGKLTKTIYEPIKEKTKNIVRPLMGDDIAIDFDKISDGYMSITDLQNDNKEFCKTLNQSLQR